MQRALSTHLFVNHRLTTVWLDRIWDAGVPLVEIFCARQHLDYRDKAQIGELGHWFRDAELKVHSLHSPMYSDDAWGRSGPQSVITITETSKTKRIQAVDEIKRAAAQGQFDQEVNPKLFHAGATLSYKENQMVEANVQLTFHENTKCPSAGFETTILLEPDIDYYPNLLAHGLLEVVPGFFSLTDPRIVYVMRWTASRRIAGIPEFDPPYAITAV